MKKLFFKNFLSVLTIFISVIFAIGVKQPLFAQAESTQWLQNGTSIYYGSGNVGIGASSPGYRFQVDDGRALFNSAYNPYSLGVANNKSGGAFWLGVNNSGHFTVSNAAGAQKLTVTNSGNVGIGTDNPLAPLHIFKGENSAVAPKHTSLLLSGLGQNYLSFLTDDVSQNGIYFGSQSDPDEGRITYSTHENRMYFEAGDKDTMYLYDGRVGIGELFPGAALSVSGAAAIGSNYDTLTVPENSLIVEGNVGIGSANPDEKLVVDGNIKINGSIISDGDICIGNCGQ